MNSAELMNTLFIILFVRGDLIFWRVLFYDGSITAHTYTLIPQTAETALCVHETFKAKTKLSATNCFKDILSCSSNMRCRTRNRQRPHWASCLKSQRILFEWDLRQTGHLTEERKKVTCPSSLIYFRVNTYNTNFKHLNIKYSSNMWINSG